MVSTRSNGDPAVDGKDMPQDAAPVYEEPSLFPPEVTEDDERIFFSIISTELGPEQRRMVSHAHGRYSRQKTVLALHWHPEFIPFDLIRTRVDSLYPNRAEELIIPTQHNVLTSYDGVYSGVEIDCFSKGFNQKIQLLLHMTAGRAEKAGVLHSMASYTFRYRSAQLHDFIDALARPHEPTLDEASLQTGADAKTIAFVCKAGTKVRGLLERHAERVPPDMIKNKILRNFMDELRPRYGNGFVNRAQAFLQAVKNLVKARFPVHYFYETRQVIEEARAAGAGIVIPHPEQFWPVLLADYDVDGIEVWNPQSRKYTEFLISVIAQKNAGACRGEKRLLILMGDDTHMSEKVRPAEARDHTKAAREIGYQPAWEELEIKKTLITAQMSRRQVLEEYRDRIS